MILSDDASDDYSNDDGTECDENYVQPTEGDWECAGDATPDDYCCSEVDATGKERTKWGDVESSKHVRLKWQNILTKLSGVISQARPVPVAMRSKA
jgi:hypothetical protein